MPYMLKRRWLNMATRNSIKKITMVKKTKKVVSKKASSTKNISIIRKMINTKHSLYISVVVLIFISQVLLLNMPVFGICTNIAILVGLCVLAMRNTKARATAIAMSIIPVTNFATLAFRQANVFNQIVFFYSIMLLLAITYRYLFIKNKLIILKKYKKNAIMVPVIIILLQIIGVVLYSLLAHRQHQFDGMPLNIIAVSVIGFALAEELLFRGFIQEVVAKVTNPKIATILTIIIFVSVTIPQGNIAITFLSLITGAALSLIYYFKQNILLTTATNITLKLIFLGLLATLA